MRALKVGDIITHDCLFVDGGREYQIERTGKLLGLYVVGTRVAKEGIWFKPSKGGGVVDD